MFDLMDDISELVYVADPETFELLYVNESGKKAFGVDHIEGQKCYEAFQHLDTPCSFCTNKLLSKTQNYTWSITNPVTKKSYLLKDRLIDWEGRTVRLEIAFDITESEKEKQELRGALDAEHMMLRCIEKLYRADSLAKGIDELIAELGHTLEAERSYIFEIAGNTISNTYEWCSPGVEPQIDNLQNLDETVIERWKKLFVAHGCVIIEDIESIRTESSEEYTTLCSQGIKSLVAAPLERGGRLVGFLGVDNPPAGKLTNIAPLLEALCYFLVSTMQRMESEQKLIDQSFQDMLTGLYNRNRYAADVANLPEDLTSLGIVYLDLNGLKEINDHAGHAEGNRALGYCAQQLKSVFPQASHYRMGGDEFALLQFGDECDIFYESVKQLKTSFGEGAPYRAAIGAQWSEHPESIEKMLAAADADMYQDKRSFYRNHNLSSRFREFDNYALSTNNPVLEEYNMLMDSLHVSVSKHLLREDFLVIWANDRFYKMTQHTREEFDSLFHGRVDTYLNHNEEYQRLTKIVFDAHNVGASSYETILNIPCKDGTRIWINLVGTFTNEIIDGYPVVYTVFTDVTDLVLAKRETGLTYDALPGFVAKIRMSKNGPRLLYGNERFLDFFGQSPDKAPNRLLKENLLQNAPAISKHFEQLRHGESVNFDVKLTGAEGQHCLFKIDANCVDWMQDDPVYLVIYLDITEAAFQAEKLREIAYVDPVTEGSNRARFTIDAEKAISTSPPNTYALVSFDIQRFKVINDTFGIEAGDRVIKHVYQSIANRLSSGEFVARFASDVFAILMKAAKPELMEARLTSLAQEVNAFNDNLEHKYLLTLTAGIYLIDDPQLPLINIHDRANLTRKYVKNTTGTKLCLCRFYDNDDRLQLARENEIENRMRDALRNGEFIVYLQPKQDLQTGIIAGAEALVRWMDPQRGLIPPMEFIPLFEKNNFVVKLDLFVFDCVCAQLRTWINEGKKPIPISVNMSRAHLSDPDFLARYEDIRTKHDIPASLLEIEVTETLIFENPQLLSNIIDDIRRCGYRCSMDDFGSGYSSLNVLKDIRVDVLKLDRAFFSSDDMDNSRERDIINSVVDMAKTLCMETIAEGVETECQSQFLKQAGCDMIQGFLFYPPMPIDEFEKLAFNR